MDEIPTIKILTLGDASVGKTCLLLRFAENEFPSSTMPTIGIEYRTKLIKCKGRSLNLQVWDTAGQERYHKTLATTFYKRVNGIALVFDLSDKSSFSNIESWVSQINSKADAKVSIILVGNKADLTDRISFPEEEKFAKSHSLPFFVVSARTGKNVEEVFNTLTEMVIDRDANVLCPQPSATLLKNKKNPVGNGCCN